MSWSPLYFIFCAGALCFCSPEFSIAGNNETDRLALLDIKAKVTNDPLGLMSSWNETLHFCEWYGVTCDHESKRVVTLDLDSSEFSGTLSPYMGNLTFLRELYLYNNSFAGPIPPEIGHLKNLQVLWLFNNSLGGEIPSNISRCSNLINLDLGNNHFVGGIPPSLGSLFHLRVLSLQWNNLAGNIPSSLGNLSSLVSFSLGSNNFVGKIPNSLGKLKKVTSFDLSSNKLSGKVPPSIFNLSFLTVLELSNNQLEGSLPSNLGITLPNLKTLSIFSNQFTGYIPISISNSSNLEILQLDSNYLQGDVPLLHNLRKIQAILLSYNFLGYGQTTDLDFIYSLSNSTTLQMLDIFQNNFTGAFPHIICNFTMLTALEIGMNKISGQIPTCIRNLANLALVYASGTQLSGIIPMSIGELKNLEILDLSYNQLSGPLPTSIGNLTQLSNLDLIGNNLEGQLPASIGNCINILELGLSYNDFSGTIPLQIFGLPLLSNILDLSHNRLTGPLPMEVRELIHLSALDISQNMLSGEIPSTLGACVSLGFLYMSGNYFQGPIPSTLTGLMGLQELNLSHNNLSGEIPDFLVKFQLRKLDLSDNNLEGEVPIGGIFSNATGLSISGNSMLCGGIPELKLPQCNFSKAQKRRPNHRMRLLIAIIFVLFGVIVLVALALLYVFYGRKRKNELPSLGAQDIGNTLSNLSYHSLLKATNSFAYPNLIGSGTYGVVYKGTFDQGRTIFAIKKFNLEHKGASRSFMAECEVLRNIRHRNLVKVITACSGIDYQGNDFKALVYEYMVNGSLEDWLYPQQSSSGEGTSCAPKNLNLLQRLDIAVDIACALEYLHCGCSESVIHCDLKPSNVLLDDEMVAHIRDFGLAKLISQGSSSFHANQSTSIGAVGTVGYAPPEYGLGNDVSKYGDVYSFGILLLEMLIGKKPTNDMFKEGSNLHNFVKAALPERVIEILDNALIKDIVEDETIIMDTNPETSNTKIMLKTVISFLEIALSCSVELPQERLDMKYVATKLSSIRNKLVEIRSRRQRRSQRGRQ